MSHGLKINKMPSGAAICVFPENSLRSHAELVPRIDIMLPGWEGVVEWEGEVTVLLMKCDPQN